MSTESSDTAADAAAFCDDVRHRLVGALTLFCGDRGVAEDVAQEALLRAWQRWPAVSQARSPEAWVFRVGMNLCRSWARRRSIERRVNARASAGSAAGPPDLADREAVRTAVRALPERQRAVIVARFYLGLGVATTAATVGCAEGTVKSATHQAIASLRASGLLSDGVDDEEDLS